MLVVKGSSQTRVFRHLYDHVFGVRNSKITKSMSIIFFVKKFKISARFQKGSEKLDKRFCVSEIIACELHVNSVTSEIKNL